MGAALGVGEHGRHLLHGPNAQEATIRHPTIHHRMVMCGTDSPNMLVLEMKSDGSLLEQQVLQNSDNRYRQKPGPHGISVQWISLHPSGLHAYAFTSFWTKGKGEAVTYAIDQESGKLSRKGVLCCTGGHQPCRATFSPGERPSWLAVCDAGQELVHVFAFDDENGILKATPVQVVTC